MDAPTLVRRLHQRLRDQIDDLGIESQVDAERVALTLGELVSFLTIEEEILYPAIAPGKESLARELSTVLQAMTSLLDARTRLDFDARRLLLASALAGHAETDLRLLDSARDRLPEPVLEKLGDLLSRFCRDDAASLTFGVAEPADETTENEVVLH